MAKNIALFASGTGTNADAIIGYFKEDESVQIALVVSSRFNAGVIDVADRNDVPWVVIDQEVLRDEEALLGLLDAHSVDVIVLAGWLRLIPEFVCDAYEHAILNIHPALLPKHGGKGMYGRNVHEAVKQAGDAKSGITIHEVTSAYDEGAIIAQYEVDLEVSDSVDDIEQKVRQLELKYYPEVIKKFMHSV